MDRRQTLAALMGLSMTAFTHHALAQAKSDKKMLILIELKGGNDGLNTLVPFRDETYRALRPGIALPAESVLPLSQDAGLHPSMRDLASLWEGGQVAVLQNVGYPRPNLSHFRSIEIWDTASSSEQVLQEGWVTQALRLNTQALPPARMADGVSFSVNEPGPFTGSASHLVLNRLEGRKMAEDSSGHATRSGALSHILNVESATAKANQQLLSGRFTNPSVGKFPASAFGNSLKEAAKMAMAIADGKIDYVPVIRVGLGSFDTHIGQLPTHANLLEQLSAGLKAFYDEIKAAGLDAQVAAMTYSEFGRRPKQNGSAGTDHGTGSVHFLVSSNALAGLHGTAADLSNLDKDGNAAFGIDFRSLYRGLLEDHFHLAPPPPIASIRKHRLFRA